MQQQFRPTVVSLESVEKFADLQLVAPEFGKRALQEQQALHHARTRHSASLIMSQRPSSMGDKRVWEDED